MQAPVLHSIYENTAASTQRSFTTGFFAAHPVLPILRSLFLSSFLWIALAFALYAVYILIAGSH